MELPWRLAESLLEAQAMRKAVERCSATKDALLAGIWGNSNYDDHEKQQGIRAKMIAEIEETYEAAMASIYGGTVEQAEEIDASDPFWAAMKRNEVPDPAQMTEEDIELLRGMEEARQRRIEAMDELDQA